jgi:hypothetical protein
MMNTFKGLLEKYLDFIMHDRIVEYRELVYNLSGKLVLMGKKIAELESEIEQLNADAAEDKLIIEDDELTIAGLMEQLAGKEDFELARRDAFDGFLDAYAELENKVSDLIPLIQ